MLEVEGGGAGVCSTRLFLYMSISRLESGLASSLNLLIGGPFLFTPANLLLLVSPEGTAIKFKYVTTQFLKRLDIQLKKTCLSEKNESHLVESQQCRQRDPLCQH